MNFDRSKAMRNAERFVAQGKIRAAIAEYKQVVDHDPRDYGTLNMLGDLYVKDANKTEAVRCYNLVAEHYGKQGFAQKAIAVYNKISRIQPNSVDVSAKLAELYKVKGSVPEAKSHYTTLAEHYQSKGRIIEALAIWKQIAVLDPNNTQVCIQMAESYLSEGQKDEAADSFAEAGMRFSRSGRHEEAADAYSKALDIKPTDLPTLNGYIRELTNQGRASDAVAKLEELLENSPFSRDLCRLLISCHLDAQQPEKAEKVLIKLVENEPSNYIQFIDLVEIYLKRDEADNAARALSMCSEHLLMGGQSDQFDKQLNAILAKDNEQLTALRMLARYHSWRRDKENLRVTFEMLARVAKQKNSVDDERYALSQLTMIVPHELSYSDRLKEINDKYGFDENPFDEVILKEQLTGDGSAEEEFERLSASFESIGADHFNGNGASTNGKGSKSAPAEFGEEFPEIIDSVEVTDDAYDTIEAELNDSDADSVVTTKLSHADELVIEKEIESIKFYFDNGYAELAEKSLDELRTRFGNRPEFDQLSTHFNSGDVISETPAVEKSAAKKKPKKRAKKAPTEAETKEIKSKTLDIAEIRSEFGLEEAESLQDSGDYDTHYQMAIAYQEMGLMEEAIKEYQDAINQVSPNDGTRRFFHCANLLGHCFMQNGMANLALKWYNRALETKDLNDEEKQAMWYELATAFEAQGDMENASKYFEQVYAENVDYRDVGERIKSLMVSS